MISEDIFKLNLQIQIKMIKLIKEINIIFPMQG